MVALIIKGSSGWLTTAVLDSHITDRQPIVFLPGPYPSSGVKAMPV